LLRKGREGEKRKVCPSIPNAGEGAVPLAKRDATKEGKGTSSINFRGRKGEGFSSSSGKGCRETEPSLKKGNKSGRRGEEEKEVGTWVRPVLKKEERPL